MFMKQYNYKPRSNSTSSTGSQGASAAAKQQQEPAKASVTDQVQGASAASAGAAKGRRSSQADKFAGLSAYKRGSEDHSERKASLADQKPGGQGILGGMWNSFTKGS